MDKSMAKNHLNQVDLHAPTRTHARMHACTNARMHTCPHARPSARTHVRGHSSCTHSRTCACVAPHHTAPHGMGGSRSTCIATYRACRCRHAHSSVCTHVYTHVYAHVDTHVYAQVRTHVCVQVQTLVHTHVHTHIYTHVFSRVHSCTCTCNVVPQSRAHTHRCALASRRWRA